MKDPINYSKMIALAVLFVVVIIISVVFFRKMERFENMVPTLTYYHLNGCGWCKKFTPEWDKFEQSAPEGVKLRKVDADTVPEEIKKYEIKGFPHVQLVNGDKVTVFNGERTKESLAQFVKENL